MVDHLSCAALGDQYAFSTVTEERYAWDDSQSGMLHPEFRQLAGTVAIIALCSGLGGNSSLAAPPGLVHLLALLLLLDERPKFVSNFGVNSCLEGHNLEGSTRTGSLDDLKVCFWICC